MADFTDVTDVDFSVTADEFTFVNNLDLPTGGVGGGATTTYHMAVWNTTNGEWVRWTVTGSADTAGASYPGPGTFGVDTQTPAIVEFLKQS
jgi:hypothetical protein